MTENNSNNNALILRPTISYTVQNAKDDAGNLQNDLRPYLKISDYENDKENFVSDSELTTTLADYATNTAVENALNSYTTTSALTEALSDKPNYTYLSEHYADLNAANTFTAAQIINGNLTEIGNTICDNKF